MVFTHLRVAGLGGGFAALMALLGCAPGASFESPDSTARLKAIQRAGAEGDRSAIPNLIEMLESDDPAVRVMAIGVLEEMTGETRGYDPYGESMERREAVDRWEAWYSQDRGGSSGLKEGVEEGVGGSNGRRTHAGHGERGQFGGLASRSKVAGLGVGVGGGAA